MEMREEIIEAIHAAAEQSAGDEAYDAAGGVLGQLDSEDLQLCARLHVYQLIRATQQRVRRSTEREHDSMMVKARTPDERVAARMRISRERFFCYLTSAWVEYGKATAEQHEARAQWYAKRIEGDTAARRRHLDAAQEIRNSGASCLDDLVAVVA